MINYYKVSIVISVLFLLTLTGCNIQSDAKKFNSLEEQLVKLPTSEIENLKLNGHLSADYQWAIRHCGSTQTTSICNNNLLNVANKGHPLAMGHLSTRMTSKKLGIYNVKNSYMWTYVKMHFVQPMELSDSEYIRSYQLLDQHGDVRLLRYLESILSIQDVAEAKSEAGVRAKELWQKLQEYCKEWKDQDYVCWYEFAQPTYDE